MTKRVAIYARVSMGDQTTENQLLALRQWAAGEGHVVAAEYTDDAVSGAKTSRSALNRLLADAAARRFNVVAVTALDRLGRSLAHLLQLATTFERLGVDLVVRDTGIDTTTPTGKLLFSIVGSLAEFERGLIRERTLLGLARARAQGKRPGRPPTSGYIERRVQDLLTAGCSQAEVARQTRLCRMTVQRIQRDMLHVS